MDTEWKKDVEETMTYLKDGQESTQTLLKQLLSRLQPLQTPAPEEIETGVDHHHEKPTVQWYGDPPNNVFEQPPSVLISPGQPLSTDAGMNSPALTGASFGTHFYSSVFPASGPPQTPLNSSGNNAAGMDSGNIDYNVPELSLEGSDVVHDGTDIPSADSFNRIYA
jgi:hypothetical protein